MMKEHLGWRDDEAGIHHVPEPRESMSVAFFTIVHGEGVERLEGLLRWTRPWFRHQIVALQGPTQEELEIAHAYADSVIVDKVHGHPEPTFERVMEALAQHRFQWGLWVSGDELPDQTLMASLDMAVMRPEIQRAKCARLPIRNTWQLLKGRVIPGWNEINERIVHQSLKMPAKIHQHVLGTPVRPPVWTRYGAIRQHRTVREFIADQTRYLERGDVHANDVTMKFVFTTYELLRRYLGDEGAWYEIMAGVAPEHEERFTRLLQDYGNPEATWEGGADEDPEDSEDPS